MKFINNKTIEIDRELSDLDRFILDFIKVLNKHVKYVIVSGYVAILLGRGRASEDVDIIISKIDFSTFKLLYSELRENKFYCLNAEEEKTVYSYLEDNLAVRFAKMRSVIPNVEMKCVKDKVDRIAIENAINVKLSEGVLKISNLELQIAFKEEVLRSPRDLEDAEYIRDVAKGYLDEKLIQSYKEMLHGFY